MEPLLFARESEQTFIDSIFWRKKGSKNSDGWGRNPRKLMATQFSLLKGYAAPAWQSFLRQVPCKRY